MNVRHDPVEVKLVDYRPYFGVVQWFFRDTSAPPPVSLDDNLYGLIRWLSVDTWKDEVMCVPLCSATPPALDYSYIVVSLAAINCRPHLVSNRDCNSNDKYWWDKLYE